MNRAPYLAVLAAIGGIALAGCAAPAAAATATDPPRITAHAIGTSTATPDTLTVVLGVQTRGPSAKATLDANSGKATALIDALKAGGVAPADLQTSQLSINPTFDPTGSRITGYEVTNLVTATLHDIPAAGGLIDAAGAAAGDAVRVQQVGFSVADDSAQRAAARADGVRRAQAQAKQLAEAAGVSLGPIRSIAEVPAGTPTPLALPAGAADSLAVPVSPGTQQLAITVEVVYGINQ